jgi:preprotein translocase subunit SecE
MKDKIQVGVAIAVFIAGLALFYILSDKAMIARVGAMLGCFVAAAVIGWFTVPGQDFVQFSKEAIEETKKVVWPTRKEAMQTTGIVFAFVFVMALFLWVVDWSLLWATKQLIGGGS